MARVTILERFALDGRVAVVTGTSRGIGRAIAVVVAELGRIDILVNSAGIVGRGPALDVSEALREAVLRTDLTGPLNLAIAAGRSMVAAGSGKVASVASLLSFEGGMSVAAYAAAKHGLVGMTKALANEWGARGVQVNAIAPGYMATSMNGGLDG